ncbi:MAG TPA: hypothetical protein VH969_18300 [Actinophytocola sp.]|jgi:hypothetical protein|uniref:hypothetical protein n=1 Tax=Actinophytocola sp. TaxID=1872138 RepID=UPI002F94E851
MVTSDVWGQLRRRVAIFTAAGGPLFAAYVITHSSTAEGAVAGVPLAAAGAFAIAGLAAGTGRRAVELVWIALALIVIGILASIVFAVLEG